MTAITSEPSKQTWASGTQARSRLSKILYIQQWFSKRSSWAGLYLKTSLVRKGTGPLATGNQLWLHAGTGLTATFTSGKLVVCPSTEHFSTEKWLYYTCGTNTARCINLHVFFFFFFNQCKLLFKSTLFFRLGLKNFVIEVWWNWRQNFYSWRSWDNTGFH